MNRALPKNNSLVKRFFKRLNKEKAGYLFILPQFIIFGSMMAFPMINGIYLSFFKIGLKENNFVGFDNYVKLFQDENFVKAIFNTLIFVVAIVFLSIFFGIIISAAIFDKSSKYVSFIRGCFYIPVAVSMVVMSVVWSFLFNPAQGLINYLLMTMGHESINFLGDPFWVMPIIIFVTFVSNIGQVIVLYVAAMIGIPTDLFEAASIDGASRMQQFRYITLPLVKPTTTYVMITQTIAVMKIYVVIRLLTNGGPNYSSVTLMYYLYEKAFEVNGRMGEAAAIGVIMFLTCLILSLIQYGFIRERKEKRKLV